MRRASWSYGDGSQLSYAEAGDPAGYPILVQHGLIASVRDLWLFERLTAAGLRVIALARPGYGASSPYPLRRVGEWGTIVALLADALGLAQFDVLGISSGAPYSYAIGWRLPQRVRNIFIFSGIPALYETAVRARWPYPLDTETTIDDLELLAHRLFFAQLTPEQLARDDIADSMQHRGFGIALDLYVRCRDWGFPLAEVQCPVSMQHTRDDSQVPFETAALTCRLLPTCRLEPREAGDHFSPAALDAFLRETVLATMNGAAPDRP